MEESNSIAPADEMRTIEGAGGDILGKSLSSAFFRGIKSTPQKQKKGPSVSASVLYLLLSHQLIVFKDMGDDLLPPPPVLGEEISAEQADSMLNERKLRESAATMAQMRERMRAMGMNEDVPSTVPQSQALLNATSTAASLPAVESFMPPPPPTRSVEKKKSSVDTSAISGESANMNILNDENDLFKTPTDSEDENEHQSAQKKTAVKNSAAVNIPATTMLEIEDLRNKTKKYKNILS